MSSQLSDWILQYNNGDLQVLCHNNEDNKQRLAARPVYFSESLNYIIIDKYALAYMEANEQVLAKFSDQHETILSDIRSSKEYRIYEKYAKKGYYVMYNSVFGSLFACYESVR